MEYVLVQRVLIGGLEGAGNQHSNDQTVDGNDTSHDNGNDRLHDQLGPHHRHGGDTGTGLGRSVGGSQSCDLDGDGGGHKLVI